MSRRSLEVTTADYEDGLLIDPQLPITKDQLFEIRQQSMSGDRHRDPQYLPPHLPFKQLPSPRVALCRTRQTTKRKPGERGQKGAERGNTGSLKVDGSMKDIPLLSHG